MASRTITPAQHRNLELLKATGGWLGNLSTGKPHWRIVCPAGNDVAFGDDVLAAVVEGLRSSGHIEQRDLTDEQKAEFSRRAGHLDPPSKGWFVTPPKVYDGPGVEAPSTGRFI